MLNGLGGFFSSASVILEHTKVYQNFIVICLFGLSIMPSFVPMMTRCLVSKPLVSS